MHMANGGRDRWRLPLLLILGLAIGSLVGALSAGRAGAVIAGAGGLVLGWGMHKQALRAALSGALIGAGFAVIVGPGADHILQGAPFTERLTVALVVGSLVGALIGVRNARRPRR